MAMIGDTYECSSYHGSYMQLTKLKDDEMKVKVALIAATVLISGCVSTPYLDISLISSKPVRFTTPEIGSVRTIEVGDSIILAGIKSTLSTISLPHSVLIEAPSSGIYAMQFEIPSGEFMQIGTSDIGDIYSSLPMSGTEAMAKSAGLNQSFVLIDKLSEGKLCAAYIYSRDMACIGAGGATIKPITTYTDASFQQNLLYSGKSGHQISLSYREFKNDTARPAFSNDATYDLSDSMIIGYKGARFEVIRATNATIEYKTLSSFK